jgi:hypothetical protein
MASSTERRAEFSRRSTTNVGSTASRAQVSKIPSAFWQGRNYYRNRLTSPKPQNRRPRQKNNLFHHLSERLRGNEVKRGWRFNSSCFSIKCVHKPQRTKTWDDKTCKARLESMRIMSSTGGIFLGARDQTDCSIYH